MNPTLAHAGGLDELAIILFPAVVGFGVWLMTRQKNPPEKAPVMPARPPRTTTKWSHPADGNR
jgi:hypothetical protein